MAVTKNHTMHFINLIKNLAGTQRKLSLENSEYEFMTGRRVQKGRAVDVEVQVQEPQSESIPAECE